MKIIRLFVFVLFVSTALSACESASRDNAPAQPAAAQPAATASGSAGIAIGHDTAPASSTQSAPPDAPVRWTPPARWEAKPASGMRAATYLIPAAAGDGEGGECAVFINIGGGVQANIDRWVGQFEAADKAGAKQKKETINGLEVTTVEMAGTFKGGGPQMGMPGAQSGPKAGYRLLGAIVESANGPVYFKFTGPAKTVAAAQAEFQAMLKSLK
jgi:hypothetical protein